MNGQSLTQLHISPRRLQQGLFASLTVMLTLIGGQQLQGWEQGQHPVSPVERVKTTQTHFRAVGSAGVEMRAPQLMAVDQGRDLKGFADQERWVF